MKVVNLLHFLGKHGTKYSRMDQVKFCIGCLPQILLGPFLNTYHIYISSKHVNVLHSSFFSINKMNVSCIKSARKDHIIQRNDFSNLSSFLI